ncbi:C39 family peptidase [Xenorhabdus bovienii]|uniref:C39 family peptidase n=1 Tax=Xenorhabdus bovienii TaxID=40576 RepID=UPI0023B31A60|nr:C39 family peptidase [Xenorhabdus bovienii]MDE9551422.1 C39 family peptidase [Xenorhabdus bovienii]
MKMPYFSQWESAHLAADIIHQRLLLINDPLWAQSGANSPEEYATWANHICGMACIKMLLASRTDKIYPLLTLTKMAITYGAYQIEGNHIRGMIYAPVVSMLSEQFGITAQIKTNFTTENLHKVLADGSLYIASVHPDIRWPQQEPDKKGGHLVLVTKATPTEVTFHNPSGDNHKSQVNVTISIEVFNRFYAERGILIS